MINDPYAVLGLSKGASQEEIKAAYRELVKKYHPDKYQGNPLADLAQEKLQEINEAYDMLTHTGSYSNYSGGGSSAYGPGSSHYNGGAGSGTWQSGSGSYNSSYGSSNSGSPTDYNQIRMALDSNDLYSAEQMLINCRTHDAEWFFLSGVLSYKKGYIQDALANVNQAISMDPGNQQYREIYQQMNNSGAIFRQRSDQYGYNQQRNADADLCWTLPLCFCLPNPFCWC